MVRRAGFEHLALEDLCSEEHAAEYLSDLLLRRELLLLLGTGVSASVGLPGWEELVSHCESSVGFVPHTGGPRTSDELMRTVDRVHRELANKSKDPSGAFEQLVREGLYSDPMRASGTYTTDVIEHRLLIALGALVMASARGSIADVFTLNFDDLLEWYLHLHGYRTQVVSDFPVELRGDVDLTVFHLHGFVPLLEHVYPTSDWLVLSHTQLVARLAGGHDAPWPTLLSSRFLSKSFLAIGTSMRDLDIDVLLTRALKARGGDAPLGFVVDAGIGRDRVAELLDLGVVPVEMAGYDAIPDFLLSVCQRAALRAG